MELSSFSTSIFTGKYFDIVQIFHEIFFLRICEWLLVSTCGATEAWGRVCPMRPVHVLRSLHRIPIRQGAGIRIGNASLGLHPAIILSADANYRNAPSIAASRLKLVPRILFDGSHVWPRRSGSVLTAWLHCCDVWNWFLSLRSKHGRQLRSQFAKRAMRLRR